MKLDAIIFISFLFLIDNNVEAQKPVLHKTADGTWKVWSFGKGIMKTTFHPEGYLNNEQISNAVIAKPSEILPRVTRSRNPDISYIDDVTISLGQDSFSYKFHSSRGMLIMLNYFDSVTHKGFRFRLNDSEKIFGAGERSIPMNRRGYKLNLYNNPWYGYSLNADNLNYSIPFIISSNGYGIFFDNPSRGYIDIGKANPSVLEFGASSGELTYYIIHGKNMDEILRRYHSLVGTQPIPGRWVFGNLMSRFGYRSEKQLLDIVGKMKVEKFPVEAVILDLFWFGDSIKQTMGNLDWTNKKAWPDPVKMIGGLKKEGIKTILITEPFVLNSTSNYIPSKKFHAVDSTGKPFLLTDFYFGHGGLLDIFRKDAQQWFWSKYKSQVNKGVAAWWGDLGEPEKHPAGIHHNLRDLGFNRLFKADEVHNIYGHYWDKMLFDRYAAEYPDTRLFNLNRSGYAGSPRYGVFPWSGDVSRSWDGLRAQLPLMLGMSMSGVPYIHADAGGFAGGDGDAELYTRWLQFAAFTPVFRPHGTAFGDLEPGVKDIPSEGALYDDPYKSIVRNAINTRYELTPYNYTLAYEQEKFGKPLVMPLYYYEQSDSNLYNAEDQFMWGDNIMVAPVVEKGATTRKLYLPSGKWVDYFKNRQHEGGHWIDQKVELGYLPVFIKEGSIIPTVKLKPGTNLSNYISKEITFTYFPSSKKSIYTLYDDDGVTNGVLRKNNFELISLVAVTTPQASSLVNIEIISNGGRFPGKPLSRRLHITILLPDDLFSKSLKAFVDDKQVPLKLEAGVDGVMNKILFNHDFRGKKTSIKIVR